MRRRYLRSISYSKHCYLSFNNNGSSRTIRGVPRRHDHKNTLNCPLKFETMVFTRWIGNANFVWHDKSNVCTHVGCPPGPPKFGLSNRRARTPPALLVNRFCVYVFCIPSVIRIGNLTRGRLVVIMRFSNLNDHYYATCTLSRIAASTRVPVLVFALRFVVADTRI